MAFSVNATNLVFSTIAPIAGYPFSLMGWFRVPDVNMQLPLMGIWDVSGVAQSNVLFAGDTTKVAMAKVKNGILEAVTESSLMTPETWHHLVAVYASDTLRVIYLDGVNVEVNTDNVPITPLNLAYFGNYADGVFVDIAEVSIVEAEVSAEQAAELASRQPMLSTPLAKHAVAYQDCIRQRNHPGLGPAFSFAGASIIVDHPSILLPTRGVSAVMPVRFRGPWQTDQTELQASSTDIGQLAMAGVVSQNSILSGEVTS